MILSDLMNQIIELELGEWRTIYRTDTPTKLIVHRPIQQGPALRNIYDPKKNIQIFLDTEGRKYKPTHRQVLMDLHYKRTSNPVNFEILFESIEDIYAEGDPRLHLDTLSLLAFNKYHYSAFTNLCLTQLFMAEQEINTMPHWTVKPGRAFLMGYIREVNSQDIDIHELLSNTNKRPREAVLTPP